jgi:hypothetical protein
LGKQRKARAAERILFAILPAALSAAGFVYERFRIEVPHWQLIGLICAGMIAIYWAYWLALKLVRRNLEP